MRLPLTVVAGVLALALLGPSGAAVAVAQTTTAPSSGAEAVAAAAQALETDSVYVAPGSEAGITAADADRIRTAIADAGGDIRVAVFPAAAGQPEPLGRTLVEELARPGVFAVIAGRAIAGGQTSSGSGLDGDVAPELMTKARNANASSGATAIVLDYVARVREARANGGSPEGGSSSMLLLWFAAIVVVLGGALLWGTQRRRRRKRSEQADALRKVADADLVALGDDIRALDIDVELPDIDPRAKEEYAKALQAFTQGNDALKTASRPESFRAIGQTLEEGRYAMEVAKAHLEGREPPEHRAPCFFDPRHGPSVRDVEWAPPYGAPRAVPACAADAVRVERGEEPHAREVELDGRGPVPYWQAPGYYGPYAGGFYGGFGGNGVLTGFLAGSLLAQAWSPSAAYAGYGGMSDGTSGDFSGGGWGDGGGSGGGDWGGGGFGGGGDFGGGGSF